MRLTETQCGRCEPADTLDYPDINSCLTVTAIFADGTRVGAHLVRAHDTRPWNVVLDEWLALTAQTAEELKRAPGTIVTAGAHPFWVDQHQEPIAAIWQRIGETWSLDVLAPCTECLQGTLRVGPDGTVTTV